MRRLAVVFSLATAALVATVIAAGGCQQKSGERCEVDTDCESPLICSKGGICVSNASADGGVKPVDANEGGTIDATSVDAVPPPDAMVDGTVADAK